ncbi:MAG: aminotransferase class I/II-fold pyridoxal phosphate-dependent enzyme [Proteobacteria bacterium]|nr:aminotransferase class I/II-fold pyridoxal phosphate-dependent enzyme [Pseudomonadota bacterium]
MKIDIFDLERIQSIWENQVEYNLTESGLHPYTLKELLNEDELETLLSTRLGYGQTNGSIPLREAVARHYKDANADNVLVTNGSAEANFIAIWSQLNPQDELVLMYPNYMQIAGLAKSFGVTIKPFYLEEDLNWGLNLEKLKQTVTPNTKMIAVCNPNNPTGATLTLEEMQEIVTMADAAGAWIYSDEIYRGAELDSIETPTFYGLYDKVIVNGGLSKAYGLPGLRLGWLVGPKQNIDDAWAYHDYTTIGPSIISNEVAQLVLQPDKRIKALTRSRKILVENLAVLKDWIDKQNQLFRFIPPKAGGMAFLRYFADINSRELSTRLREEMSVFIMDGDCFGMDHFIRIGFGSEQDYLLKGLDLIADMLQQVRG